MGGDIQPGDVPRSASGRIPKWVLDEALGNEPTERVPFRGPSTSVIDRPRARRLSSALKITAALSLVLGLLVAANALGIGSPNATGLASNRNGSVRTTARDYPPTGHEESRHPLGTPPPLSGTPSTSYRFEMFQADRTTPVTWSPCRPIHYVVRPDNAPTGGAEMISAAFAQLHQATGFVFVNDGTTSESPSQDRPAYQKDRYGDRWAPVLVLWATPDEVPDFGIDVLGEAGPQRVTTGSGDYAYVTGDVALDPFKIGGVAHREGTATASAVILHELGHLMGLAHVNDRRQVMFPALNYEVRSYAAGDLAGLARLSTGPCQRDV
jgi:hypothetical protein